MALGYKSQSRFVYSLSLANGQAVWVFYLIVP